jgi:hypothetical protein
MVNQRTANQGLTICIAATAILGALQFILFTDYIGLLMALTAGPVAACAFFYFRRLARKPTGPESSTSALFRTPQEMSWTRRRLMAGGTMGIMLGVVGAIILNSNPSLLLPVIVSILIVGTILTAFWMTTFRRHQRQIMAGT